MGRWGKNRVEIQGGCLHSTDDKIIYSTFIWWDQRKNRRIGKRKLEIEWISFYNNYSNDVDWQFHLYAKVFSENSAGYIFELNDTSFEAVVSKGAAPHSFVIYATYKI